MHIEAVPLRKYVDLTPMNIKVDLVIIVFITISLAV